MTMARNAAALITDSLRCQDGTPVPCDIGCTTIGGGKEAVMVEEQLSKENVVVTLSVTRCWCYGAETMDLNPDIIKAVRSLSARERPGTVCLAAVMATCAQRDLSAFSINGEHVQDRTYTIISRGCEENSSFTQAAVAVRQMMNKAYVNLGGVSLGVGGSCCDANFMQKYPGIRTEWLDLTEILRWITPAALRKTASST